MLDIVVDYNRRNLRRKRLKLHVKRSIGHQPLQLLLPVLPEMVATITVTPYQALASPQLTSGYYTGMVPGKYLINSLNWLSLYQQRMTNDF